MKKFLHLVYEDVVSEEYHLYAREHIQKDKEDFPDIHYGILPLAPQADGEYILLQDAINAIPKILNEGTQLPESDGSGLHSLPEDIHLDRMIFHAIFRPDDFSFLQIALPAVSLFSPISAIYRPSDTPLSEVPAEVPGTTKFSQGGGGSSGGAGASGTWTRDGTYFCPNLESFGNSWEYAGFRQSYPTTYSYWRQRYSFVYSGCDLPQSHIINQWDSRAGFWWEDPTYYKLEGNDIETCNKPYCMGMQVRMASYTSIYVCEILVSESSTDGRFYPPRGGTPASPKPGIISAGSSGGAGASGDWLRGFAGVWPGKATPNMADYQIYIVDFSLYTGSSPTYL